MTTALFGLVGVIVGGLVTAGTQFWQERRERNSPHDEPGG